MNAINVGIGELAISTSPDILKAILGSCVGVAIYSQTDRIGGLIHIMLPSLNIGDINRVKYANTGIPILIIILEKKYRVKRHNLTAKIAGGANMFSRNNNIPTLDVGTNNIAAVRHYLNKLKIPIIGEDVGENYGRRIEFYLESGKMKVVGYNSATP